MENQKQILTQNPLSPLLEEGYTLILASNSPRRKEILASLGLPFTVRTAEVDESFPSTLPPRSVASYLAEKKANAYVEKANENEILITADTVVVVDGQVINKPSSVEEAHQMLRSLSGKYHEVITAVAISDRKHTVVVEDIATVEMKFFTDEELYYYIKEFSPYDKAGAYGIQEWIGLIGVTKLQGSFYTVMGLPVHLVYDTLKNWTDR